MRSGGGWILARGSGGGAGVNANQPDQLELGDAIGDLIAQVFDALYRGHQLVGGVLLLWWHPPVLVLIIGAVLLLTIRRPAVLALAVWVLALVVVPWYLALPVIIGSVVVGLRVVALSRADAFSGRRGGGEDYDRLWRAGEELGRTESVQGRSHPGGEQRPPEQETQAMGGQDAPRSSRSPSRDLDLTRGERAVYQQGLTRASELNVMGYLTEQAATLDAEGLARVRAVMARSATETAEELDRIQQPWARAAVEQFSKHALEQLGATLLGLHIAGTKRMEEVLREEFTAPRPLSGWERFFGGVK